MRELRELRRYRQGRVLATCAKRRHAARVATLKTQIRQRLGAEVARLRTKRGMATQADLAEAASLGVRSVWAAENGEKVAPRTLRKIEAALDLPPGAMDEFLEGEIEHLAEPTPRQQQSSGDDLAPLDEVLQADLDGLKLMARMWAHFKARQEGRDPLISDQERFMLWALQTRADMQRGIEPSGDEKRDVS